MKYQPESVDLQSLYQLLIDFDDFPKSSGELKDMAKTRGADKSVVNFFEDLPDKVFNQRSQVFEMAETIDQFWAEAKRRRQPDSSLTTD